MMSDQTQQVRKGIKVSYQGLPGAYSHLACKSLFPESFAKACHSFEEALEHVHAESIDYAVIPVENAIGGRVADVHNLLPKLPSLNLWICAEHFQAIDHCLLGPKDAKIENITRVFSHEQALLQCREFLLSLTDVEHIRAVDTAGAAMEIAKLENKQFAAIASRQAAEEYGLSILQEDIANRSDNRTRFLIIQKGKKEPVFAPSKHFITSFTFVTRSIPAALYKCLGGFATNSVNFLKLESYVKTSGNASFYAEIEAHPQAESSKQAFDELGYFTQKLDILGVYERSAMRETSDGAANGG